MLYVVNFTSLGAGYFLCFLNSYWVLFWDTVKLLGNHLVFLSLAPKLCWVEPELYLFKGWFSPLLRQNPFECYSQCTVIYEVFSSSWWGQKLWPCVNSGIFFPLYFFSCFLPWLWVYSLHVCSAEDLRGCFSGFWAFCCSLLFSSLWTLGVLASLNPQCRLILESIRHQCFLPDLWSVKLSKH